MNSLTHFRVLKAALLCCGMLAAFTAATAASTCPFDTGGSDAVNDGVVLTRYALGITGAPMTVSTRYASLDPLQVKNNIECVGCALDMNGGGNIAGGFDTVVGGGRSNFAAGNFSVIPGGLNNSASGEYSFAAGQNARAFDASSFVWGARAGTTTSNGAGSFTVSVPGDIVFYATNTPDIGCSLTLAGWHCTSDRATKKSIRDVNVRDVLKRVVNLAVPSWEFIGATDNRHIGPMAQDFKKAFNLGDNDKTISAMDMGGVALAAIQGLNQKLSDEVKAKNARINALEVRLLTLEQRFIAAIK